MTFHRSGLRHARATLVLALCMSMSVSAAALADAGTSEQVVGDTPADFAQPVAPAPLPGDTPSDHPGMSRAPKYAPPSTIQVVRPERTIVRDVDAVLPTILASLALLVALGGVGLALVRTRPGAVGRTH